MGAQLLDVGIIMGILVKWRFKLNANHPFRTPLLHIFKASLHQMEMSFVSTNQLYSGQQTDPMGGETSESFTIRFYGHTASFGQRDREAARNI